MQQPLWMHHWLILSLHAAERAKVLTGADQTLLGTVADWAALQPVRYVNEAKAGEWRLHSYLTTVGRAAVSSSTGENLGSGIYAAQDVRCPADLSSGISPGTSRMRLRQAAVPFISGNRHQPFVVHRRESPSPPMSVTQAIFWAALTASVERNVPGADSAWNKVTTELTNLTSWSGGFAAEPRYNRYPRNK